MRQTVLVLLFRHVGHALVTALALRPVRKSIAEGRIRSLAALLAGEPKSSQAALEAMAEPAIAP